MVYQQYNQMNYSNNESNYGSSQDLKNYSSSNRSGKCPGGCRICTKRCI